MNNLRKMETQDYRNYYVQLVHFSNAKKGNKNTSFLPLTGSVQMLVVMVHMLRKEISVDLEVMTGTDTRDLYTAG